MGASHLADIPGNFFVVCIPHASAASNAADGVFSGCHFVAPAALVIEEVGMVPDTSQAGSATNYRDFKAINEGTGGAGTTVVASYTLSATGASVEAQCYGSWTGTGSMTTGQVLSLQSVYAGNGIPLVSGTFQIKYRLT